MGSLLDYLLTLLVSFFMLHVFLVLLRKLNSENKEPFRDFFKKANSKNKKSIIASYVLLTVCLWFILVWPLYSTSRLTTDSFSIDGIGNVDHMSCRGKYCSSSYLVLEYATEKDSTVDDVDVLAPKSVSREAEKGDKIMYQRTIYFSKLTKYPIRDSREFIKKIN
ncbi:MULTISPECIES: hypothetical protein [Vagococcus]|uniref:Uncharacterized protein n=1 Tax=Vagococcus fluvialis bH819 TaxID=1255619 RepID=A0A1X6WMU3_9ENTE|nr:MULTISPECIES: hypothetical protein [Vagococcus]SLM84996.1 hypothetical protein FM121_02795 [Vagococcus fluvialis bH819]HCM88587.1 hypothetical protein [Vagococcus sp.]